MREVRLVFRRRYHMVQEMPAWRHTTAPVGHRHNDSKVTEQRLQHQHDVRQRVRRLVFVGGRWLAKPTQRRAASHEPSHELTSR